MASKPVIIQSPTPLVYNDSIDTTNMTNVLLIDSTIIDNRELYDSANANTFPIIYSYSSKTSDLLALLRQKFSASSIQRIALIFHDRGGNYAVPFMNNKSLFDDSDLIENQTSFTENVSFLIECIKEFNVANIDFLACNTLKYSNWKSYYSLLVAHTSVVVGASNDATGNVQYGGDWVMESTGQDIKQTYFTDSIDYYKYLFDTINIDDIVYTFTPGIPTASATGFVTGITTANIPSTINISGNTYNVISIGVYAFAFCSTLTSVTIGNSVATIGVAAFQNCSALTSVSIGNSVTTIETNAFNNCIKLASVTIPDSVTTIGNVAFYNCKLLTAFAVDALNPNYSSDADGVLFNKDQTTLIQYPIGNTRTTYTIPSSVITIYTYSFAFCTKLVSVTIPNSVISIGNYAFKSCLALTSVSIGNSVATIGANAFDTCSVLTSVTIPSSVITIGLNAFLLCSSLTAFAVDVLNLNYSNDADGVLFNKLKITLIQYPIGNTLTSYTIPSSVENIEDYAFTSCTSLNSVSIGNFVENIGNSAFANCISLTSVSIPDSVTTIGNSAFQGCTSLNSVSIPDSVTTIGNSAFSNCTLLASVTIGDSVTTIEDNTFQSCSALTSVTIPNSVESIGNFAFLGCSALTSVFIGNSVATIGIQAFLNCILLTSVIIPDSVTTIGDTAFQGCFELTSVTLPTNALFITIGLSTFRYCAKLASVTIPDSVTTIGQESFGNCTLLASVTISDSVASIGDSAFFVCTSLTSVTIPNSVSSIGNNVFQGCSQLNLVYFLQTSSIPTIGTNAFTAISFPSVGKYYSGVANLSRIAPPVFTFISPIGDVIQTPNPLVTETPLGGQVLYTDPNYDVIPDISSNTTYTLRTNVSDPTKDVFTDSTSLPQAFIPNSLFINYITNPMGIARDSVGNFYVADGGAIGSPSSTINVYPPSGINPFRFITLDSGGSGLPGQTWVNLRWLAFDSSDNLYVTNEPDISVDPSGNGIAFVAAGASTNTYSKTIFPPSPDYTYTLNCGRGIIYYNNYLYIPIRQNTLINPPYLIKYNIISGAYLTLNLSEYLPDGGFPIMVARNPLYLSSPTPFLYLASHPTENKILSISEISGSETTSGGTGTANIGLLYAFSTTQIIYSLVTDNSGNLYLGTYLSISSEGQISRVAPTGVLSSSMNMNLDSINIGQCRGLLFDGSLNLYVSDSINNRVIKSQPKTFVFGGVLSQVNPLVNTGPSTSTYLYDIDSATSVTSFSLNIASYSSNPVVTQTPNPLFKSTPGQVIYTDLNYGFIPDISNNPTYTLRTNVADSANDVFTDSTSVPQAFIPNSLFTSSNLINPTGIARDSTGKIYVANSDGFPGTISVYDSDGTYERSITLNAGTNWFALRFLTFDTSNNLYVSAESPTGIAYVPAGASTNDSSKTIFPSGDYANNCRGLSYYNNFLYISIRNLIPPVVIKYDVTSNDYLVLDVSGIVQSSMSGIVRNPFYVSSPTPFLYLAAYLKDNGSGTGGGIVSISEITGTPLPSPGGTGSATISTLINFGSNYAAWTVVVDNSANLYVGINLSGGSGQIARLTPTGVVSNISRITLSSLGIGQPRGLLFDGSLNLYVTDVTNSRVIKSQPKTFVFGGPSIVSPLVNQGASTTTYLYDISNNATITTFDLNIECFKKGTKILCENDVYIPIEDLKIGDLVKTYKRGYQKVIMSAHSRLCDYVKSVSNQLYTYSREKNPDLIEDLHLTGGHSLLMDTLTEDESTNMKQIQWPHDEFMVEDKYKLLAYFSSELCVAVEQHVDIYHFTLEPPENAKLSHVYGVYANGILAESCSQWAMEEALRKKKYYATKKRPRKNNSNS